MPQRQYFVSPTNATANTAHSKSHVSSQIEIFICYNCVYSKPMPSTSSRPQKPIRLHGSHSPTHTTNRGDTVNCFTFKLTFSLFSWLCNTKSITSFSGSGTKPRMKENQWLFKRPQPVCIAHVFYRQMDAQSIKPIQTSPRQHTFVFQSPPWHQVGICWFFNICKSLQTAALGQIFTTGPSGAYVNDCTTTEPNMRF